MITNVVYNKMIMQYKHVRNELSRNKFDLVQWSTVINDRRLEMGQSCTYFPDTIQHTPL